MEAKGERRETPYLEHKPSHGFSQNAFLLLQVHPPGQSDRTCPHTRMYGGFVHIHAQVLWHKHKNVHRPLTGSRSSQELHCMCAGPAPTVSGLPLNSRHGRTSIFVVLSPVPLPPS